MNEQIIELLKSKPHNTHYLKRYVKFINSCQIKNLDLPIETYFETHHILPKSKDSFPEYQDLRKYRWNAVKLTARQHIIAHIILWKVYVGTQFLPVYYMLVHNTNPDKRKECVKIYEIKSSLISELKTFYRKERQGKGIYKDSNGNRFFLHRDDPKIQELDLVGNKTGFKFSEESKQIMSFRKKHLKLYFLNLETSIKIDTLDFYEKWYEYESQGWVVEKTEFDKDYCSMIIQQNRQEGFDKSSRRLKGKMRYTDQDGVFRGWFYKDDLQIQEQNLKPQWTENNQKQNKERLQKAKDANFGSKIYNDGIREIKRKEHPGENWILGRLPRTDGHHRDQSEGLRKARLGKIVYNDGIRNFYIDQDQVPESHWIKGMKPRKSNLIFINTR